MIALFISTALAALNPAAQDATMQDNGAKPNVNPYEFCISQVGKSALTKEDCDTDPTLLPYVPVAGSPSPDYMDTSAPPAPPVNVPPKPIRHAGPVDPCSAARSAKRVSAADMRISFENGSAQLSCEAQANLRQIAIGMQSRAMASLRYRIVGHTSATGSAAYNQGLSERRAQAVVRFLVGLRVSRSRLQPEGVGFNDPLPGVAADHGDNRRVEAEPIE